MKKMIRKIMIFGMAVVMLFSFVAFVGCESVTSTSSTTDTTTCDTTVTTPVCPLLEEYRANAIEELEGFVSTLDENDFAGRNWEFIESRLRIGRNAINAAIDKEEVRTIFNTAKQQIEAVPQRDPNPQYLDYWLDGLCLCYWGHNCWFNLVQEGILVREDIKNIAYHIGGGVVRSGNMQIIEFESIPIGELKEDNKLLLYNLFRSQFTISGAAIFRYVGTYNGIIVTFVQHGPNMPALRGAVIADVRVSMPWSHHLVAWQPNSNV